MSTPDIQPELDAIRALVEALTPLSQDSRQRAIEYALRTLDVPLPVYSTTSGSVPRAPEVVTEHEDQRRPVPVQKAGVDIRTLANEKQPRSAMEMAAVVAYFLSELTTGDDQKDAITTEDLRKYFRQAGYPLPGAIQYTLGNAASAGFFESAGRGLYKLTSVGYNLVAHNLPAGDAPAPRPAKRAAKKATAKKATAKKATAKKATAQKAPAKRLPAAKQSPTKARKTTKKSSS
jgi:hypothetical protein